MGSTIKDDVCTAVKVDRDVVKRRAESLSRGEPDDEGDQDPSTFNGKGGWNTVAARDVIGNDFALCEGVVGVGTHDRLSEVGETTGTVFRGPCRNGGYCEEQCDNFEKLHGWGS